MSKILTRRTFRAGWNDDEFLQAPSDLQVDTLIDRSCEEFTARSRNPGQIATLTISADTIYVPLPLDFIDTVANQEALRAVIMQACPYNYNGYSPDTFNGRNGANQLNYGGQYNYPGASPELYHNISQPLRPPQPKPAKINIQQRKIAGVLRPVLVLPVAPTLASTIDITYQGKHQIENAFAVFAIDTNLVAGDTITIATADIEETIFTMVASGATTYQINLGMTKAVTAANIKAKLIALLTNDSPPLPGFDIEILGSILTITAADGDDFTIETDSDDVTISYTAAIDTISDHANFYKILEALVLRGMKSQHLIEGKTIAEVQRESRELLSEALTNITPRTI